MCGSAECGGKGRAEHEARKMQRNVRVRRMELRVVLLISRGKVHNTWIILCATYIFANCNCKSPPLNYLV